MCRAGLRIGCSAVKHQASFDSSAGNRAVHVLSRARALTSRHYVCCLSDHKRVIRFWWMVKVRITKTPREPELDDVQLYGFISGMVREVSPLIGAWLITQGYALPEMRQTRDEDQAFMRFTSARRTRRRRRRPERRFAH